VQQHHLNFGRRPVKINARSAKLSIKSRRTPPRHQNLVAKIDIPARSPYSGVSEFAGWVKIGEECVVTLGRSDEASGEFAISAFLNV
jgi:hypothetical protein